VSFSTVKDLLIGAYRGSPGITILCIYVVFAVGAMFTHQYVKGISKQPVPQQPIPAPPTNLPTTTNPQPTDTTCSNISAGRDAHVNCSVTKEDHDQKKTTPQH